MSEVAQTILAQLGGNKFVVMTGSKNFIGSPNALSFKLGYFGPNGPRATHVRVTLTPADLYDVEFFRIRGTKVATVAKVEGIYNDMLREVFTRETGLATSLGNVFGRQQPHG